MAGGPLWANDSTDSGDNNASVIFGAFADFTDAEGLTDAVTVVSAAVRALTDALALTDAVARLVAADRAVTDAEGLTDEAATVLIGPILVAITDALGLTDTVTADKAQILTVTDVLGLLDRLRWLVTVNRAAGCAVEPPSTRAAAVADPTSRNCPTPSVGPYGNRRNP